MEDDLFDAVLLFVFLRDQGVVVSHPDLILLSAVAIPAETHRGMNGRRLEEEEGV